MSWSRSRSVRLVALAVLSGAVCATALLSVAALEVLRPPRPNPVVALDAVERTFADIRAEGTLRVAVTPDQVGWTTHRGRGEGLVHDLVRRFARQHRLVVEPVVPHNAAAGLRDVLRGRADVYVTGDSGPRPVTSSVLWTAPLAYDRPVVVGRRAGEIRQLADLAGRTVAVRRHSALEQLAFGWLEQLDGQLSIRRLDGSLTDRQLAAAAARGGYDLVLMDGRRARLERGVYTPLQQSTPLDLPQPVRWAVRPNAPALAAALTQFVEQSRQEGLVADLERRYLENPERLKARRRPVFRRHGETLSPWDGLFRKAAYQHGFDWRLLAALSFAESGYDPWERSSAGAMGLLQLMPKTAAAFGATDPWDPEQNVAAGAHHLKWLHDLYDGVDEPHRLAFALAAYNMGLGHVQDARGLAASRGLNPDLWHGHVATVLPELENVDVAARLTHGMARGRVTKRYVEHVMELYRQFIGAKEVHSLAAAGASG